MRKRPDIYINIVLVVAVSLIGIFGFLNLNSKPKISKIELSGSNQNAEIKDQRIVLHFSRPIKKESIDKKISFEPNTDFETYWGGNNLYIAPKSNLKSNFDYKLKISGSIEDIYGLGLNKSYEYKFHTKELKILYLSKSKGSVDKIYIKPLDGKSKPVYEKKNIKKFIANSNYIVADIGNEDNTDSLFIYDENLKKETELDWGLFNILEIDMNPVKNEFVAILQSLKMEDDIIVLDTDEGSLMVRYNIDSKQKTVIKPNYSAVNVSDVHYSPNGESLLYLGSDDFYYITDLNNSEQTSPLDKYIGSGGFNENGDNIVFLQSDPRTYIPNQRILIMNAQKETRFITSGKNNDIDPKLFAFQEKLAYAEEYDFIPPNQYKFKIIISDLNANILDEVKFENDSLELPIISPDEKYLIAEKYTEEDQADFSNQRIDQLVLRPYTGKLILYDIENKKIIEQDIDGINAVWI